MSKQWILEGFFGSDEDFLQRMPLRKFPARVGRDPELALAIVREGVSRAHAEFFEQDGDLFIRDLGSTNGTFLNHQPLYGEKNLRHGDVLHFASYEVRVLEEQEDLDEDLGTSTRLVTKGVPLSNKLPTGLNELQILLDERAIRAEFQPIVGLDGALFGYEVLGRGSRADLPIGPMALFRIAESMPGKASALSELMRDEGVVQAYAQSKRHRLFVNTHPDEIKDTDRLLTTLQKLRELCRALPLVLEIHEDAVTDVDLMKKFATELALMEIELAYDDFGSGRARLMELIEVPVSYVKFDIALIRGLHNAQKSKQNMVAALVAMTKAMGIQVLAEGVEGPEELALCKKMKFDLIQGFHFSKPRPLLDYRNPLV
jgi:EAL domain-containing protein (putative c-di-GMP-specific phosphodiesterase class I)